MEDLVGKLVKANYLLRYPGTNQAVDADELLYIVSALDVSYLYRDTAYETIHKGTFMLMLVDSDMKTIKHFTRKEYFITDFRIID